MNTLIILHTNRLIRANVFIMVIFAIIINLEGSRRCIAQTTWDCSSWETAIMACDDGGVYYMRQVAEFNALFWLGQQFGNDPAFSNVFFGRLIRGVGVGEHDFRIDRWVGKFFDVPKGRTCEFGDLEIETFVVPSNPRIPWCDFPECYLRKVRARPAFPGNVWGLERAFISGCWEEAPDPVPPLPLGSWDVSVHNLSSASIPAGFQGSGLEILSGTWQGDDGGTYYIRDIPITHELVWFAEHPTAAPGVPSVSGRQPIPPSAFANVFIGTRNGDQIEGLWADVPRGGARGYGRLKLRLLDACTLEIIEETGGYGGRILRRYESVSVDINFSQLDIRRTEDSGGDEPKLENVFAKMDGDGIDRSSLSTSRAILDARNSGRLGNNVKRSPPPLSLSSDFGHFNAVVKTILGPCQAAASPPETMIGVAVAAWDEDRVSESSFDDWVRMLQSNLDIDIRGGRSPNFVALAGRRHFRFRWRDGHDYLGYGAKIWKFAELLEIARRTPPEEDFQFEMTGDGAHYITPGKITVQLRLNPVCLWIVPGK